MGETTRRTLALVGLGLALLVAAALVPVSPVRWHDTSPEVPDFAEGNATALAEDGYEVVDYGNLSNRAQRLYVETLTSGGEYRVPAGEGAPEFEYPTRREVIASEGAADRPPRARAAVVVERPDGSDLPPADEDTRDARFDVMRTKTAGPPLASAARAPQLALALGGLACLGVGGSRFATL